jgi:hypothetical protein
MSGGGVFSVGKGSLIEMNDCTVRHMRQMGIEACNGGAIKAVNCLIVENQLQGVPEPVFKYFVVFYLIRTSVE